MATGYFAANPALVEIVAKDHLDRRGRNPPDDPIAMPKYTKEIDALYNT
jgi:hypothetical protein